MFPNDAGTAHARARPRRLPATSPTAISRLGCRTGNGPRTSPGIRAGDGKGRASRRWPTATTAGSSHARPVPVPTPGSPTGCSSGPRRRCRRGRIPWCIPTADAMPVARMAGAHGPLRPGTVDGRQGPFPGRRCGGVPRTHEDGVRLSRALGGAYP